MTAPFWARTGAIAWAAVALFQLGVYAVRPPGGKDYFDLSLQTRTALEGRCPYHAEVFRDAYARAASAGGAAMAEPEGGFYYPPATMAVLAPLSPLPFAAGKWVWSAFLVGWAAACGTLAWTFGPRPARPYTAAAAVAGALLLHPATQSLIDLGQTALLVIGGVAAGQLAFENRRPVLGSVLWGLSVCKPHLALPFLAVAYLAGGWRRVAGVVAVMALLNVAGAGMTGRPVEVLADYLPHVRSSHLALSYNTVANDQVVSINRVVYALGGPAWDFSAPTILLAYGLWAAAVWARGGLSRPVDLPYALAAAAVGAVAFGQAKGYDLVLLAALVPYLRAGWAARSFGRVGVVAVLVIATALPRGAVAATTAGLPQEVTMACLSYRAFAVLGLVVALLAFGPVRRQSGNGP